MKKRFPEGFLWGTATSAFQVEMGRSSPSKGSDWYAWVHDKENIRRKIVSGDTPEDGPGSWELYPDDFRLAREELGNNAVRLSMDWARIFPEPTTEVSVEVVRDDHGDVSKVEIDEAVLSELRSLADPKAVRIYREMLSDARSRGLTVMLTLYHWPIPSWLHDPIACRDDVDSAPLRGWLDQSTIIEFAKYAAYTAHTFGDLVDLYATVNEPRIVGQHGYLSDPPEFPPGLYSPEHFMTVLHHLSIAHAVAYDQVKKWDKESSSHLGPATVGVVCVLQYFEPADPGSPRDVEAARFVEYLYNEWSLNSVTKGDFDVDLDGVIQPHEQRPHMVRGCDFIGVNYYTRWFVKHAVKGGDPRFDYALSPGDGELTDSNWDVYPTGLRHVLNWAYARYRRPIYITENGITDSKDERRVGYLLDHLEQLHAAIEDGVPVLGYFHWSLMDNFEWSDGYRMRFGLFSVDRETKERTPTKAAPVYREIASSNTLPE